MWIKLEGYTLVDSTDISDIPEIYTCLSGWRFGTMEFYDCPYIGNVIIPSDTFIFFRGVETTIQIRKPETCGLNW
jgi:hypothetical protein